MLKKIIWHWCSLYIKISVGITAICSPRCKQIEDLFKYSDIIGKEMEMEPRFCFSAILLSTDDHISQRSEKMDRPAFKEAKCNFNIFNFYIQYFSPIYPFGIWLPLTHNITWLSSLFIGLLSGILADESRFHINYNSLLWYVGPWQAKINICRIKTHISLQMTGCL